MSEQFQWTTAIVVEFFKWKYEKSKASSGLVDDIKEFIESKQPKPEWEILVLNSGLLMYERSKNVFINGGHHVTIEWALDNDFYIYSVKRLSDNEVFTIGNKFTGNAGCDLTIKSFEIDVSDIKVWSVEYGYWPLRSIKKRVPLFKTEDGVYIYEDMKYWCVAGVWRTPSVHVCDKDTMKHPREGFKYFSTKEKAEEWIIENRPTLSFADIRWAIHAEDMDRVRDQVRSIINETKQADSQ